MASNSRPQPYRLKWPWTAPQIENADEMFEILYKRVYALEQKVNVSIAGTPGTGTASNSAILGLLADPAAGGGGSDDDVKLAPPGPAGPQGPIGPGVQAFFEMGNEEERLLPIPPIPPLPIIDGRAVAQAAAVATVATYTPGADASFLVSANVLVTTATTHNFKLHVGCWWSIHNSSSEWKWHSPLYGHSTADSSKGWNSNYNRHHRNIYNCCLQR
jgi:hypothetical protein